MTARRWEFRPLKIQKGPLTLVLGFTFLLLFLFSF